MSDSPRKPPTPRLSPDRRLPPLGWREWIILPKLGGALVKVKVDTGARSSSLHAFKIEPFLSGGAPWVRFQIHPLQRNSRTSIPAQAPVLEYRHVKSSGGHTSYRPVILTPIELAGLRWEIELTLASRDSMGFRMLLGRQAIRTRFVVDPGRSYLASLPKVRTRKPKT